MNGVLHMPVNFPYDLQEGLFDDPKPPERLWDIVVLHPQTLLVVEQTAQRSPHPLSLQPETVIRTDPRLDTRRHLSMVCK